MASTTISPPSPPVVTSTLARSAHTRRHRRHHRRQREQSNVESSYPNHCCPACIRDQIEFCSHPLVPVVDNNPSIVPTLPQEEYSADLIQQRRDNREHSLAEIEKRWPTVVTNEGSSVTLNSQISLDVGYVSYSRVGDHANARYSPYMPEGVPSKAKMRVDKAVDIFRVCFMGEHIPTVGEMLRASQEPPKPTLMEKLKDRIAYHTHGYS